MKKIIFFLTIVWIIALGGCEKYDRAQTAREQIYANRLGQKAGAFMVATFDYIDHHTSGYTLEQRDSLARERNNMMGDILHGELIREIKNIVRITSVEYRTQRDESTEPEDIERRKTYLWEKVVGGDENLVDENLSKFIYYYPRHLVAYVHTYVIDTLLFGGGVRTDNYDNPANYHEQYILDMFGSVISWEYPPEWLILYSDEPYYLFFYYGIDPANYAKAIRLNLPVPSIEEMRELYPREKIESFKTVEEFQEWSKTQADYTQIDWKPVAIQADKK